VIQRTPYGVFYTATGNRVFIGAILDLRQAPDRIHDELEQRG
jgi:hypothetical protein